MMAKRHIQHVLMIVAISAMALAGKPVSAVTSASPSSTAAATDTPKSKQIENLMDRLATKVAELRQVQKKAVFGKVSAASLTSITVGTTTKDVKVELADTMNVAQFLKGKRTKLTSDDISKGDTVTVFGDYDATVDMMKATAVFIESSSQPTQITGTIKDVNKTDYSFTVTTKESKTYTVDFETSSKYLTWDTEKGLVKGGFSKLTPGDVVGVTGTINAKDETRISAQRIITLTLVTPAATPAPTAKPTPTDKAK